MLNYAASTYVSGILLYFSVEKRSYLFLLIFLTGELRMDESPNSRLWLNEKILFVDKEDKYPPVEEHWGGKKLKTFMLSFFLSALK